MTKIRIGTGLRDFLIGMEPDPVENGDLWDLVDLIQGLPKYPLAVDLDPMFWPDVWYFAGLLDDLEPSPGERRAARAAMTDLRTAGYTTRRGT